MIVSRESADIPLFRIVGAGRRLHYAPGHLARRSSPRLRELALRARLEWEERRRQPFAPECLTVNLTDKCNLSCSYCYTKPARGPAVVSLRAVEAAGRLVAANCAAKAKPFHLVVHGGGEPTLEWSLLGEVTALTRRLARDHGLEWFGYIATNGTLSETQAEWLGAEFSLVGLSSDGPPEIQQKLRAFGDGRSSATEVQRTARAVMRAGGRLSIRATIVPETVDRQRDLVAWFHEHLGARDLRFEPAYSAFQPSAALFGAADAPRFVSRFLEAQQESRRRGCSLQLSGVRFDELHGTHCNPLRDVLQILPSGEASLCSFAYDVALPVLGSYQEASDEFMLDTERIRQWKLALTELPERCEGCINILHCTRECPERCPLTPGGSFTEGGFRCRTNKLLGEAWLREAATDDRTGALDEAERLLQQAPQSVDGGAVLAELERAVRAYPMASRSQPKPVWTLRRFDDGPGAAWRVIDPRHRRDSAPLSVYVHVPFCDRLCGCCDCHSAAGGDERRFLATLHGEIDEWSSRPGLAERPVTTVHFGGGTPTHLSPEGLGDLVGRLRARLATTPATEWAAESTTSQLTPEMVDKLEELGVTRIHVGLQSLEPGPRAFFGRRETAEAATIKIEELLRRRFVVSVDLVYGLQGETLAGWVHGIETLADLGVHGFSLYRLNVTPRNEKYVQLSGAGNPAIIPGFVFFQAGHQVLERRGYRKNHFAHFARPEDSNLYYTHAARGEDLLAIGPSADGIFGDYRYRHVEHEAYLHGAVLEGGLRETEIERRLRGPSARLMSAAIERSELDGLGLGDLADRWIVDGLVAPERGGSGLRLAGAGSWFIGPMLEEMAGWCDRPQLAAGE